MTTGATVTSLGTLVTLTATMGFRTIAARPMGAVGPTMITTEIIAMVARCIIMMTMTDVGISGLVRKAGRRSVKFAGPGSIRATSQIPRGTAAQCPEML